MAEKIIFHVGDLRKFFGQKEVLKGITLAFLEGAKIGLIGPNGAGKSTLLKIMAGIDKVLGLLQRVVTTVLSVLAPVLAVGLTALALATTACTAARGSFSRTLQASGPVTVRVATGSGNIHVMPGDPNTVQIIGHVHAFGPCNAQRRATTVENNPPSEQSGGTINIGRNTPRNVSVDYDITVPPHTQLAAHSGAGNLRVINIAGSTNASTGSGNIRTDGLGGHVVLYTGSGNIRAGFENSNDVKAQTGSGNIILRNVQGILFAHTGSGNIDVSGAPSGGWDLKTGSGNVTLHTGNAHYSINASTGSGSVHSNQSITTHGNIDHHHLTGDVNGGDPTVRTETGCGTIRIQCSSQP